MAALALHLAHQVGGGVPPVEEPLVTEVRKHNGTDEKDSYAKNGQSSADRPVQLDMRDAVVRRRSVTGPTEQAREEPTHRPHRPTWRRLPRPKDNSKPKSSFCIIA